MGLFKILSDIYSVFAKQIVSSKPPQKLQLDYIVLKKKKFSKLSVIFFILVA